MDMAALEYTTGVIHSACSDMIEAMGGFKATGNRQYLAWMEESEQRAVDGATVLRAVLRRLREEPEERLQEVVRDA